MQTQPNTEENSATGIICSAPWRLKMVAAQDDYCLKVVFIDGLEGCVNLKAFIFSPKAGVFAQLQNLNLFNQVYLSYGVATWPGELDLAPDAMHENIQKYGHWNVGKTKEGA